ncbi:hypothetical protein JR316_0004342 [Psilocybe cubensis]|uniref:Uncharacterized protein n=2 Tax=Psilocybe cubensis TaxID=181762 RepID=A0ACB8H323_PSICU|nr:hypothetical protein JR316_0004342 [Psilocybe cubensis]KAH9482244.1 hypothetical protein JR316_0004342 [Psilocybe cubensis]
MSVEVVVTLAGTQTETPTFTHVVNLPDGPIIRFPPFPQAPDGVQVVPFKDFTERGISMNPGPNDTEIDTLGVPTVPLRSKHNTDGCKTNTKRKRREDETAARKKIGLPAKKLLWWEEWQEREAARVSVGFDRNSTRFERIHAAAADFTDGRSWPLDFASESGPKFIWERFLRYIGLSDGTPAPSGKKSKAAKQRANAQLDEDMSDEVGDGPDEEVNEDPMAGIVLDKEVPEVLKIQKHLAEKEDKLSTFFENPEKSIRIFLTSHAREMGYIWTEANQECIGHILQFFVNYLLRSKVLPEIERSLRRSLEPIAASIKEIPNISAMAKVNPDNFSKCCIECYGRKTDGYSIVELDLSQLPPNPLFEDPPTTKIEEVNEDGDSKDKATSGWGNYDPSWGNSGWGNDSTKCGDEWGGTIIDASSEFNGWDDPVPEEEKLSQWTIPKPKDVIPPALAKTHTTGIVEQSMRRIKSIIPPPSNPPPPPVLEEGVGPDAADVENDLERQFTKLVLGPMIDWDGGEYPLYSQPTILPASVGAVAEPGAPEVPEGIPKPYDPFNDEITLLIESTENVALFSEGMGLGGVWVQLVRQANAPVKKKKKGKSKSKKVIPNYWYMEELSMATPSFWAI